MCDLTVWLKNLHNRAIVSTTEVSKKPNESQGLHGNVIFFFKWRWKKIQNKQDGEGEYMEILLPKSLWVYFLHKA